MRLVTAEKRLSTVQLVLLGVLGAGVLEDEELDVEVEVLEVEVELLDDVEGLEPPVFDFLSRESLR